jgi:lipopolysaccharide transport system ATP-binding protein
MENIVIQAQQLSKRYRLGAMPNVPQSFREMIHEGVVAITRRVRSRGETIKQPRDYWALRDVTFSIPQGEVVGIIGNNGAGKSTLLKILSRITEPTGGMARIRGRVGSLLEVGTGFHPELTGRENIYLSGAVLGMSRRQIDSRFDEIVDFSGITEFLDTPVKRYSSGMYVRLAFAVAAHLEPQILIVDEVLAVGDAAFQQKCLGKIGDVARTGRTVLLVSHNLETMRRFCQRCLLLSHGQLVADGKPADVVARYLGNEFTNQSGRRGFNPQRRTVVPQRVKIVDAWTGRSGQKESVFSYGDNLELYVELQVEQAGRVALEMLVRDETGHPIVFLPSGLRFNREFDLWPGKAVVRCKVKSLPLAQGRYTLDIIAADSGRVFLDCVQSGLDFLVANCDPQGTGNHFRQDTRQGCVHLDADFRLHTVSYGQAVEGAIAA